MDSALTTAVCRALAEANIASLRFNFRPMTEGSTMLGGSACEDVGEAYELLTNWKEVRKRSCGLVGYSAGAAAVARQLPSIKSARAAVLITPPVSSLRTPQFAPGKRPVAIIAGEADKIANIDDLRAACESIDGSPSFITIPGAGHSLAGAEAATARAVASFLDQHLRR